MTNRFGGKLFLPWVSMLSSLRPKCAADEANSKMGKDLCGWQLPKLHQVGKHVLTTPLCLPPCIFTFPLSPCLYLSHFLSSDCSHFGRPRQSFEAPFRSFALNHLSVCNLTATWTLWKPFVWLCSFSTLFSFPPFSLGRRPSRSMSAVDNPASPTSLSGNLNNTSWRAGYF